MARSIPPDLEFHFLFEFERIHNGLKLPVAIAARQALQMHAFIAEPRRHAQRRQCGKFAESANAPQMQQLGGFRTRPQQIDWQRCQRIGFPARRNHRYAAYTERRMQGRIGIGSDSDRSRHSRRAARSRAPAAPAAHTRIRGPARRRSPYPADSLLYEGRTRARIPPPTADFPAHTDTRT